MTRSVMLGCSVVAALLLCTESARVEAQTQREEFTNLQVLPKDIPPEDLRNLMATYTRALGVRCRYCHVEQEGEAHSNEDFAKDDKPEKAKAREMMRMTQDLNDKYLANLVDRANPPVRVQCATCHHGVTQPRPLQEILRAEYEVGGMDSTLARYQALRKRYYGGFSYDFGEVPLTDLASQVRATGHPDDAQRLLALNVEMNPESSFAKRRHAGVVLAEAFKVDADSGAAAYRRFEASYGDSLVTEAFVNNVGYDLLGADQIKAAIEVFLLNVSENPESSNAYDSLGEGYLKNGDRKQAIAAYETSLELDPANENAVEKLRDLGAKPKNGRGKH